MRKFYQIMIVAICLAFTVGCQTTKMNQSIFQLPSSDAKITNSVLETMLTTEGLANLNVHVETIDGVVMLSGYVKTIRQSDMSEDVARKTPGVKSVRNNIIVRK